MEHPSTLRTEAAEQEQGYVPAAAQAHITPDTANNGTSYAVGGLICLIVGIFVLGIPLSLVAINLGGKAVRNGSAGFGTLVRVAGWIELALTLIAFAASL